jgi:hypothetical protein
MDDVSPATFLDHILLGFWSLCTFLGCVGLLLYLPMSTQPALEALSETPTFLTVVFGICAMTSFGLCWVLWKRPAVTAALKGAIRLGTAAAVLGFASYATYVYGYSHTLPDSDAPAVGEVPPDFEVKDPDGRTWKLSNFRGTTVLLVFYRGDW